MKHLMLEVGFSTDEFGEVSFIDLKLSDKVLDKIKKALIILNGDNPPMNSVTIWHDGYLLDEEKQPSKFKSDGGELLVFSNSIYYKTQSKYDGSVQIESEGIEVSDLFSEAELRPDPIREARALLKENGYFVENLWTIYDVIEYGSGSMNREITEEQAKEIFEFIGRIFDAEQGINWDTIAYAIEEHFKNQ